MINNCEYCNKEVSNTQKLYFGYDHICCSNNCRLEVIQIIINNDRKLRHPEQWKNIVKKSKSYNLEKLVDNINISKPIMSKKSKSFKNNIDKIDDIDKIHEIHEITNNKYYLQDLSFNLLSLRQYLNLTYILDISKINFNY